MRACWRTEQNQVPIYFTAVQAAMPLTTPFFHLHQPMKKAIRCTQRMAKIFVKCMVPIVGIELTTYRLQGGCSTN